MPGGLSIASWPILIILDEKGDIILNARKKNNWMDWGRAHG
jgi:hypothetical protein